MACRYDLGAEPVRAVLDQPGVMNAEGHLDEALDRDVRGLKGSLVGWIGNAVPQAPPDRVRRVQLDGGDFES